MSNDFYKDADAVWPIPSQPKQGEPPDGEYPVCSKHRIYFTKSSAECWICGNSKNDAASPQEQIHCITCGKDVVPCIHTAFNPQEQASQPAETQRQIPRYQEGFKAGQQAITEKAERALNSIAYSNQESGTVIWQRCFDAIRSLAGAEPRPEDKLCELVARLRDSTEWASTPREFADELEQLLSCDSGGTRT